MRVYGTNEYGNRDGFKIICQNCGREAHFIPTHYIEDNKTKKIVLEIRCICGNKYGADIHNE